MRIWQVIALLDVFEKLGTLLLALDLEAVIKSAASAGSRKTEFREPRSRRAPGQQLGKRTAAGWGTSLDLGPLDLFFLEAALAGDSITASMSLHGATTTNPFLDPAV